MAQGSLNVCKTLSVRIWFCKNSMESCLFHFYLNFQSNEFENVWIKACLFFFFNNIINVNSDIRYSKSVLFNSHTGKHFIWDEEKYTFLYLSYTFVYPDYLSTCITLYLRMDCLKQRELPEKDIWCSQQSWRANARLSQSTGTGGMRRVHLGTGSCGHFMHSQRLRQTQAPLVLASSWQVYFMYCRCMSCMNNIIGSASKYFWYRKQNIQYDVQEEISWKASHQRTLSDSVVTESWAKMW